MSEAAFTLNPTTTLFVTWQMRSRWTEAQVLTLGFHAESDKRLLLRHHAAQKVCGIIIFSPSHHLVPAATTATVDLQWRSLQLRAKCRRRFCSKTRQSLIIMLHKLFPKVHTPEHPGLAWRSSHRLAVQMWQHAVSLENSNYFHSSVKTCCATRQPSVIWRLSIDFVCNSVAQHILVAFGVKTQPKLMVSLARAGRLNTFGSLTPVFVQCCSSLDFHTRHEGSPY